MASNIFSQNLKVNLDLENATIKEVLLEVKKQTDYSFLYNNEELNDNKRVSIKINNITVDEVLSVLLKNQDLAYTVENNIILIHKPTNKAPIPQSVQQSKRVITGTVIDGNGEPIIGANVIEQGTTNGVITNLDGSFSLSVSQRATLQISYIGYVTQEIAIGNLSNLSIKLQEDSQTLGEVVVTALGITKEAKALGYAVSTINAGEITKVGSPNLGTALYGKAAGVRISAPPGGSAAGVAINIRGLNSINGSNDPMVFVNGVPIRNGNNDDSYNTFASVGLRSNGLVDINTEDIETLTILKGASATALYGSEAANGVVMITTKRAKGSGVTADVNITLQANTLAYLPKIQTEYGPGIWTAGQDDTRLANGGFSKMTYNGKEYDSPWMINTGRNHIWGPKYDGRDVIYWDGSVRKYEAITSDSPFKELFRTGWNQMYNVAINQGAANTSNRFSYTYTDEIPNGLTGSFKKHNFNLTGTMNFNKQLAIDYSANYILQKFHNRQGTVTGAYDSFSNMFSSFTDIPQLKKMYKTSLGYKNFHSGDPTLTPDESFIMDIEQINWLRDYFWGQYENNNYETDSRFIGSVAPQWKIFDFLTLRGRVSTDVSADKIEVKTATERSLALSDPTGEYRAVSKDYSIYHADIMLMFNKNINDNFNVAANIGWNGRSENMFMQHNRTDGGLTVENMFMLGVSRYTVVAEQQRMELLKTAFFGSIDLSYKNYLFLGVTGRQEKSSTLPGGSNSYFYPSVNTSFVYTDAIQAITPYWYNYGKLRLSYGKVGNAPAPYAANIVYDQNSNGGISWSTLPTTMGNSKLKPEKIREIELGWENKLFNSRLGLEVSLYHRKISDMIIQQPTPISDGIENMWMNVGTMINKGLEISANFIPVQTRDFDLEIFTNMSFGRNKVTELAQGIDYLRNNGNFGNTGGGVNIRSYVDRPFGDLYVNKPVTVTEPNSPYYGHPIVEIADGKHGYFRTTSGEANQEYIGNIQPKVIGGLGANLRYKNFSLDIMSDFRFGGHVLNSAMHYPTARGLSTYSMLYRDPEHDGLTYTYNGHELTNGMIVPGVVEVKDAGGNITGYEPNTTITPSDYYYNITYNWGNSGSGTTYAFSVKENSYWKLRELALGYDLPNSLIAKSPLQRLRISVFARNLFYFYKTLDEIDPESNNGGGTSWNAQSGVGYSSSPTRTFGLSLRATF